MEHVFVDTGAWDAIEDGRDAHHAAAILCKAELVQQKARLYMTNFVLDECYTLLLYNIGYAKTVAFKQTIDQLRAGGILIVLHVSEEIERFNKDKEWSFTDCVSKVVMENLGIQKVFAFDHHFEQMGFMRIPENG
jgi:uncharacterized protein